MHHHRGAHAVRAALLVVASTAAIVASSARAQDTSPVADDTADQAYEQLPGTKSDIVVTGTRASLENAERIKRDSDVMLDGISADDIGQLPDASMTEAILTVPGLQANGNDTLTARGLGRDFINQEIDGRIVPSPQPGTRAVQTGSFPTEGISGLFLQKTPAASTIEGGSGGTVLIQTIHPLETRRQGLQVILRGYTNSNSAKLSAADGYANVAPRVSASYVKKVTDNFGIAITGSLVREFKAFTFSDGSRWGFDTSAKADPDTGALTGGQRLDLNGDGVPDALPQSLGEEVGSNNDFRKAVIGMVQWDVTPSLRLSLDGFYNTDNLQNSDRAYFAFGVNNGVNGPAVSATVNQYDSVMAMDAPVTLYRGTLAFQDQTDTTFGGGLNAAFDNGGPISFKVDGSYFKAMRRGPVRNFTFENDAANQAGQRLPFSYDVSDPRRSVYNFAPLTADDYALVNGSIDHPRIDDSIAALRADFAYKPVDSGFIKSIDAGVRIDRRHKTARHDGINYTFGVNQTTGKKDYTLRPDLDSSDLELATNPLAGRNPFVSGENTGTFPWYDIDKLSALITAPGTTAEPAPSLINGYIDDTEDTFAMYGQVNFERGILSGNIGVRYVLTDSTIIGPQGDLTNYSLARYSNTDSTLLPSLNAKLQLTRALDVRLALSKTLTRPIFTDTDVGATFDPVIALQNGYATINQGNPNLKPYVSKGIDAAVEWFPTQNTALTINGFVRFVSGFHTEFDTTGTVVVDGVTLPSTITTTINNPKVVHFGGIELTARQQLNFLPGFLSGLGVYVNYDRSFTDAYDTVNSLLQEPSVLVYAGGFSKDVIGAQLFYDSGPLNLRLSYRYSSPAYNLGVPGGQLNASANYKVNKNVSLMFSMTNIIYRGDNRYVNDYRFPGNNYQRNTSLMMLARNVGQVIQAGVRFQF
jgi:TonB-dependent receptor